MTFSTEFTAKPDEVWDARLTSQVPGLEGLVFLGRGNDPEAALSDAISGFTAVHGTYRMFPYGGDTR